MRVLYFDCFAGAAGDMILGALLDAGLPLGELKAALGSLAVDAWDVSAEKVVKGGISATKFRVHERPHIHAHGGDHHHHEHQHTHDHQHHHHHTLPEIEAAIERSSLSTGGKTRAKALFTRLAEAEAAIHDMPVEHVHLHEVGALDSIIDIVGSVFAMEWFGADRIAVSPMNVGGGMVKSAHGVFPVPAPATLKLLGDAPVYSSGIQCELLTPTGALLLTGYADAYGPMPAMRVDGVGYGAGDRDLPGTPNVLRVVVGTAAAAEALPPAGEMRVVVLACEIDDMNPQLFGPLMDRLYAAGALEVFYQPVQMKKNRPGTLVTIIARPDLRGPLSSIVFRETTTIGMRYQEMPRMCLDREMVSVPTPLGAVRFKVARRGDEILNAQPEFDDLAAVAASTGRPLKEVQALAWTAWTSRT